MLINDKIIFDRYIISMFARELQYILSLLYLININWLSVDFDWSRAGHVEGAILSCRMIILPSGVISALKSAGALVVTCFSLQCTWGCYSVMSHDHITL